MQVEMLMTADKQCVHSVRYTCDKGVVNGDTTVETPLRTIYVMRTLVAPKMPDQITVTIQIED